MEKVISFMNNKGGVLKTTLVTNIAGVLAKKKKKVLIIDTDPQGSSIGRFGRNADEEKHSLTEYLVGSSKLEQVVKEVYAPNISIVSADFSLSMIDNTIINGQVTAADVSKRMKALVTYGKKHFDYVLIDSAPTFGRMTNEVLKATDKIIVPTALEQDSFKGVTTMINILTEMDMINKLEYIVPTMVKTRTNLHKNLLEQWLLPLAKANKVKVTKTIIKDSIRVATSTALDRIPLTLTNSKQQAKMVFFALVKELGIS